MHGFASEGVEIVAGDGNQFGSDGFTIRLCGIFRQTGGDGGADTTWRDPHPASVISNSSTAGSFGGILDMAGNPVAFILQGFIGAVGRRLLGDGFKLGSFYGSAF